MSDFEEGETKLTEEIKALSERIAELERIEEEYDTFVREMGSAHTIESIVTLAAGIAHDLSNLMVGVSGNTELLMLDLHDNPYAVERLEDIFHASQEAGSLAREMMTITKGGVGPMRVMNLNDTIEYVLQLHKGSLPERIRISYRPDPDLLNVIADTTQMGQVVMNLLINAVEAIEGSGAITISAKNTVLDKNTAPKHATLASGPYVCLTVEDTGQGMDEETKEDVFEPFFSTKYEGRGLGLASVRSIITNHRGDISVVSEKGKGTTFEIYLPATDATREDQPECGTGIAEGDETILLYDNDESLIDVITDILKRIGYHVLQAATAQDAVDLARNHEGVIHLALLDIGSPSAGRTELIRGLKERRPGLKLLLCVEYESDKLSKALIDSGVNGFIRKPFRMESLGREIRRTLNG